MSATALAMGTGLLTILAGEGDSGARVDRVVTAHAGGLSRSRVQALIRDGHVRIGGATVGEAGHRVKPGDHIEVHLPEPVPADPLPEALPLAIVHEDRHLIVIDKPAGLVVHPAPGHASGTLVNALLAHCGESLSGIGGVKRPGIVHRLDRDTSGLLVVAKSDRAHRALARQFELHGRDGRLVRRYLALAWGVPDRPAGRIEAAIDRSRHDRTEMAVVREGGRPAATHWVCERAFCDTAGKPVASLLRLELETGRTHQVRVHLAHIGHPVMGDPVYGTGFKTRASRLGDAAREALVALPGQALHAAVLGFEHPETGEPQLFESAPPRAFALLLEALASQKTATARAAMPENGKNRRRKR